MSALEKSLLALAAEHGLESISFTTMTPTDLGYSWFDVNVQWYHHGAREIASGTSKDSISQALGNAIASMHAQRGDAELVEIADVALTAETAA